MRGSIGYVVQEPEVTDDFKQFLIIFVWLQLGEESSQLPNNDSRTNICSYSKLTSRIKRAWLTPFDSWTPSQLPAQIRGLAEPGCFLEIE